MTRSHPAELGLGTASLIRGYGLRASLTPVDGRALIGHALERGVRYIDTAAAYGDSERLLGESLRLPGRAQVRVATKLTASDLLAGGFAHSLERLHGSHIDTLMLHSAGSAELNDPRTADALMALKSAGAIRRAGASTYGSAAAELALSRSWCDAVQVEHSILNPSVMKSIDAVRRHGQEVVVRSVLCKGLLTGRRAAAGMPPDVLRTIDDLEALATDWSWTLPQLAVRFALDTPGVDVVVVGVSDIAELDAALAACAGPPLESAQRQMLARFDRSAESWTHPETWTVR